MLASMTGSDWAMWRDYYTTMPDREEHYLAQICALLANANFKRPDKKLFTPADFAPDLRTPAERAMAAAQFAQAEAEFEMMRKRARAAAQKVANGSALSSTGDDNRSAFEHRADQHGQDQKNS